MSDELRDAIERVRGWVQAEARRDVSGLVWWDPTGHQDVVTSVDLRTLLSAAERLEEVERERDGLRDELALERNTYRSEAVEVLKAAHRHHEENNGASARHLARALGAWDNAGRPGLPTCELRSHGRAEQGSASTTHEERCGWCMGKAEESKRQGVNGPDDFHCRRCWKTWEPASAEQLAEFHRPLTVPTTHPACTCGSGAHPRKCKAHPWTYEQHVLRLNCEGLADSVDELCKRLGVDLDEEPTDTPGVLPAPERTPAQGDLAALVQILQRRGLGDVLEEWTGTDTPGVDWGRVASQGGTTANGWRRVIVRMMQEYHRQTRGDQ